MKPHWHTFGWKYNQIFILLRPTLHDLSCWHWLLEYVKSLVSTTMLNSIIHKYIYTHGYTHNSPFFNVSVCFWLTALACFESALPGSLSWGTGDLAIQPQAISLHPEIKYSSTIFIFFLFCCSFLHWQLYLRWCGPRYINLKLSAYNKI